MSGSLTLGVDQAHHDNLESLTSTTLVHSNSMKNLTSLTGTAAHYTLINTHLGVRQAHCENLESLASTTLVHSHLTTNLTILTCASSSVTFLFVKATSTTTSSIGAFRGHWQVATDRRKVVEDE